ncbi:hypothetical protein EV702DRAFT_1270699 [Suillus placidus]|uniref:Uncharacterized protein n=1 Tax=Suillus placidus TaxID=48579 RepID=A0A9P7CZ54_9AGAM|nr:hypothetical protein EV702DRAFT_1270699 [Suillus placidus]
MGVLQISAKIDTGVAWMLFETPLMVVLLTGGFTPFLTLMQNLAQRGAHIIALSPKPVQAPEVEILINLLRSTSMRKLTRDPICDAPLWLQANAWRYGSITMRVYSLMQHQNPTDWPAQLFLGLESINTSETKNLSEKDRAQAFLAGTKFIEKAFNANQKSAAAAYVLCELFLRKGSYKRALKLVERTIQFADALTLLTEGNLGAAWVQCMQRVLSQKPPSAIGMVQMQIQNDEIAAAMHTLDLLLQPPNPQCSVEAMVMLASLRAHPRPGVSSSDFAQEKAKARELFDRAIKALEQDDSHTSNGHVPQHTASYINDDLDMHVEIARLWQEETSLGPDVGKGMSTSMLYNHALVYEDGGDVAMAKEAYDKLLARRPEYVDAKVRQAQMLSYLNQSNEAHDLLKQAMASQNTNLNLRAFYTYFLIQSDFPKPAKDFVFATLKDHDKHDVYSLCAAGLSRQ